jgi:thiol-disulfide isomerase/thioredoxin
LENPPPPPPLRSPRISPDKPGNAITRLFDNGRLWQFLCVALLVLIVTRGLWSGGTHPLRGQPAPAFTLAALEGEPVNLDDPLGEQVIVLDFWASWCGPCREGLPVIAEVAAEYANKGVVTYAVNVGERPEDIRAFVQETRLKLPVLVDESTGISSKYGVEGIPQTVIIGRDGIVHEVHVGLSFNMGDALRGTLDTLLAVPASPAASAAT